MGMFDTLYYDCPKCGAANEEQTKSADRPMLRTFYLTNLPLEAAPDLGTMYCQACQTRLAVRPKHRVEFEVVVLDDDAEA